MTINLIQNSRNNEHKLQRRKLYDDRSYLFPTLDSLLVDMDLELSISKEFAKDKSVESSFKCQKLIENIVRKGEMLITSIFSFSYYVFKKLLSVMSQKYGIIRQKRNGWMCSAF